MEAPEFKETAASRTNQGCTSVKESLACEVKLSNVPRYTRFWTNDVSFLLAKLLELRAASCCRLRGNRRQRLPRCLRLLFDAVRDTFSRLRSSSIMLTPQHERISLKSISRRAGQHLTCSMNSTFHMWTARDAGLGEPAATAEANLFRYGQIHLSITGSELETFVLAKFLGWPPLPVGTCLPT